MPLASLRVFVGVAEQLSFSRAAQSLGVSTAAVSQQIRSLEEYLRVPLFLRRGHTVQLTAEGSRLLPRVRDALAQLERTIDEARRERRAGALTVTMLATFLQQWLLPRLPNFERKFPDLDLRLHTSTQLVDFLNADVQVAIRFGLGSWPHVHAERILEDWLVPVCARGLFESKGGVENESDLKRYELLHSNGEPWRAWVEGRSTITDEWAACGTTFDDSVAVIRAAQAGRGLALARWSLVCGEIAAGGLVVASRRVVPMAHAYHFVCPSSYLDVEKVAAFREWLLKEAQAAPLPPSVSTEGKRAVQTIHSGT
jgi:LysR family transcriptional regulator, glycine cleavage system transcriptional activator